MGMRSERVRSNVEHEKRDFISASGHVSFCLLFKHTNDGFLTIFRRIPKILLTFPQGQRDVLEHLLKFWNIAEDFRR